MTLLRLSPLIAIFALALGFSLLPLLGWFFDALAMLLASTSRIVLVALSYEVLQTGTELREADLGFAIEVTEACDGHGLLIAWVAILLLMQLSLKKRLLFFFAGFLIIQLFNLLRINVLFAVSQLGMQTFNAAHYYIFPLLTALLMLLLTAFINPKLQKSVLLTVGLTIIIATLWFLIGEDITIALTLPAAEFVNGILGFDEVGRAVEREAGWRVMSQLVQSQTPLRFYLYPFYPADFTLALPVILASVLAMRSGLGYLALAIVSMAVALALNYHTGIWTIAIAKDVAFLALSQGDGTAVLVRYEAPSAVLLEAFRLAQNVVVHFLLLVCPVVVLLDGVPRDDGR